MQLETKAAFTLDDAGAITATAWVFDEPDQTGDVITKGAFGSIAGTIPILWMHDQREPIGVWESVVETAQGLVVKGRLLIETVARAKEAYALLKAGAINGVSIGFNIKNFARRSGGGRTISALSLAEVSIVTFPAHAGARVTSLKSANAAHRKELPLDDQTTATDVSALETKLAGVADEVKSLGGIADRIADLERKAARPAAPAIVNGAADLERKAFNAFLHGDGGLELKTLNTGTPATGGVLIPTTLSTTIIQKLTEFSPVRSVASAINIGGALYQFPREVNPADPASRAELAAVAVSEPTFELIDAKPYEMAVKVPVSRIMFEDSAVDLASYLTNHVAKRFGKMEASWFVNGDGTAQAEGVLTSTEVQIVTTAATTIAADDILNTFYAIPSAYSARGHWLMNRATMLAVAKLKNSAGDYIWRDGNLAAGQPATLMGRPVLEAVDMPAPAAGNVAAVFGDFAEGYTILDRVGYEAEYDRLTGWSNGIINLLARRRVGGRVTLGEALVKLRIKAS